MSTTPLIDISPITPESNQPTSTESKKSRIEQKGQEKKSHSQHGKEEKEKKQSIFSAFLAAQVPQPKIEKTFAKKGSGLNGEKEKPKTELQHNVVPHLSDALEDEKKINSDSESHSWFSRLKETVAKSVKLKNTQLVNRHLSSQHSAQHTTQQKNEKFHQTAELSKLSSSIKEDNQFVLSKKTIQPNFPHSDEKNKRVDSNNIIKPQTKKIDFLEKQKQFVENHSHQDKNESNNHGSDSQSSINLPFISSEKSGAQNGSVRFVPIRHIPSVILHEFSMGKQYIVFHLEPKNLGAVRIQLYGTKENPSITIHAEQPEGYHALQSQMKLLMRDIQQHFPGFSMNLVLTQNNAESSVVVSEMKNDRQIQKQTDIKKLAAAMKQKKSQSD